MGQKVNPIGLRLGINRTWDSRWFAEKNYAEFLHKDFEIRQFILKSLPQAGISKIIIERPAKKARLSIYTSRPGVLIGKKGADIATLRQKISKMVDSDVTINIVEMKKPDIDATLVAQNIAHQIEKRVSFRRAMKRAMHSAQRNGALGIRVNTSGRLSGAEIARVEWYREGRVPLHTFRSDIDYALAEAKTAYGIIGIKVWIYKGDIKEHDPMAQDRKSNEYAIGRV